MLGSEKVFYGRVADGYRAALHDANQGDLLLRFTIGEIINVHPWIFSRNFMHTVFVDLRKCNEAW